LIWRDGKRPDGATLVVRWSTNVVGFHFPETFAPSHLRKISFLAGAAASAAEAIKVAKYSELFTTHQFIPVAVETGGVWGQVAEILLKALGRRLIGDFRRQSFQSLLETTD